jgi:hypothetical protein
VSNNLSTGIAFLPSVLPEPLLLSCQEQIGAKYMEVNAPQGLGGDSHMHPDYVPTASSFGIRAVFLDEQLTELCAAVHASCVGDCISAALRGALSCDLDQSWVRRQYAPQNYPRWHSPHGWHQDGALKFDFAAHPDGKFPSDVMLPLVTCWIALNACGVDAPGLELVSTRLNDLLPPAQLKEEAVRARFGPNQFWTPALEPGDALLFRGDILHRTYVTPAMSKDRTSIELRFFPADNVPSRLAGDRFIPLPLA